MIFTGKAIDATEAERIGLINRVVPTQDLIKSAHELADKLAKGPSLAIGLAKEAIWRNLSQELDSALNYEAKSQRNCLESEDHREAIKAFLEKREPHFGGK
jgi:2-(1,2-epoxy-1,2-dihydrophenyl)acetyl-CoA isomerase